MRRVVVAFDELDVRSRISPLADLPAFAALVPSRRPTKSTNAEAARRLALYLFKDVHIVFMVMRGHSKRVRVSTRLNH